MGELVLSLERLAPSDGWRAKALVGGVYGQLFQAPSYLPRLSRSSPGHRTLVPQEGALLTVSRVRSIGVTAVGCAAGPALLMLVLLTACSSSPDEDIPTAGSVADAQSPPTGRELFVSNCAACHGAAGEGQPEWHIAKADGTLPAPPLNGDGHTWHHADGLLYRIVSQGGQTLEDPRDPSFKSAMPAFGDRLSREELIEVLTYVKSLWADKTKRGLSIRESQALVSEQDPFLPEGG